MRVLRVCVAAACTGVARVAPQNSGSGDAAGISARARVRGREMLPFTQLKQLK